jgi:hypothetical protein
MEKLVKIVKREKKYVIYFTILFLIIINLFLIPNSPGNNLRIPDKINENPFTPISPDENSIKNNENKIPIAKEKDEDKTKENINKDNHEDEENVIEKKNNEDILGKDNNENEEINTSKKNENYKVNNKENINRDSNFIRRIFRTFENLSLFSFIGILMYLLFSNGNNSQNINDDEIKNNSKVKKEKDGYALLDDDSEYFENI